MRIQERNCKGLMSVPNNKRKLQHIRKSENVENWFTSVPGKYNFLPSMEPSALIKKDDNRFAAVYGFLIQPFKHQVLFYPVPKSVRCDKETNCKTSGSSRRRRGGKCLGYKRV